MAISIGTVTLQNDLMWINEFEYPSVGQSARLRIDGNVVVQSSPIYKNLEIQLGTVNVTGGFSGYFTRSQIVALKAYEQTQAQVTFVYESFSTTVVIKANGISVTPIIARPNAGDDDIYRGTITMIEV